MTTGFELREDASAYRERTTKEVHAKASIMDLVTREVCEDCNNGWMSVLESQARPHLEGLLTAARTGQPMELDAEAISVIARWVQKTALTIEITADLPWPGSPEDRLTLMDGGAIRRAQVWLGRMATASGVYSIPLRFKISDNYHPRPDDPVRAALFQMLLLEELVIAAYLPEVSGREWPPMDVTQWVRLWPLRDRVDYPPLAVLDQESLTRRLVDHRDWLPMTAVNAVERSPIEREVIRRN